MQYTEKQIKDAILDYLMQGIDQANKGVRSQYRIKDSTFDILVDFDIKVEGDRVKMAGVPVYEIERRYSERKINGNYPELKPILRMIETEREGEVMAENEVKTEMENTEEKKVMRAYVDVADLKAIQPLLSKDKTRSTLTHTFIEVGEDLKAAVVGTDSYKMGVAESWYGDNKPGQVIVDLNGVKFPKNGTMAMIEYEEGANEATLTIATDHQKSIVPVFEGNYPNYRKLMPKDLRDSGSLGAGVCLTSTYIQQAIKTINTYRGSTKGTPIAMQFIGDGSSNDPEIVLIEECANDTYGIDSRCLTVLIMHCKPQREFVYAENHGKAGKLEEGAEVRKVAKLEQRNEELSMEVTDLTVALDKAKCEKDELLKEIEELKSGNATENPNEGLQKKYTELQAKFEKYEQALIKAEEENAELKASADGINAYTVYDSEVERKTEKVEKLETENAELKAEVERLKSEKPDTEVMETVQALQQEAEELRKQLQEKPKRELDGDIKSKVDALIQEHVIEALGETSIAMYVKGKDKKALKEAGFKPCHHKKFGRCWYVAK